MARFKVCLQQYVEKVATVEVEADSPEQAVSLAKAEASETAWEDGDDAYSVDAYAVLNHDGSLVWER